MQNFSEVNNLKLVRLIIWHGLSDNGMVAGKFFDRQELPFRCSLSLIVDSIYEKNFQHYLKHPEKITENLINYKLDEIQWLIKLGSVCDPFAPPFAVKRHDYGIRVNLTQDSLTSCFQSASKELMFSSDHNLTKVIPVTSENLVRVLNWHAEEASRYLQEDK
jgi:hypothetical protein